MAGPLPEPASILMMGVSHRVAPVDVRERLAFGPERARRVLHELMAASPPVLSESVLLSTCNRTEIYVHAPDLAAAHTLIEARMSAHSGLPAAQLSAVLYARRGEEAALHLMRVAAGLESLVLCEPEILGQVRLAADIAQSVGSSGPVLATLFRYAVAAGKRARTETGAGQRHVSVATVVVDLAAQLLGDLQDRTALLIGAGKISSLTARSLVRAGLRCVMIANRTFELAQKLAGRLNGTAVHFDALEESLAEADIVICSTGAPHIVLHANDVARAQQVRGNKPLLVVDLAVPRDVDSEIAGLPGVRLINIDGLEAVLAASHPLAASVRREVEAILQEELEAYLHWLAARRFTPLIRALNQRAEVVYRAEVEQTLRRLGRLTPRQEQLVQAMGKSIAGKMIHGPLSRLRILPEGEDADRYARIVQDLYDLE